MPSRRTVGRISSSTSRVHSEYSVCSAAIGCTLWARSMVRGRGLGQAEVAHLALLHQLGHGAHRLLDRRVGVDAVLVVEVDHLDAEPLQALVAAACAHSRACR